MIFLSKKLKCQRGESDFPWFTVLIGIPILLNIFGGDDDEKDNKVTDTSNKAVLEEKARKTKANDMIDTAKKEFENAKKTAQEKMSDARDEYNKARKVAVEKIDTAKKEYNKSAKEKNDFSNDVFSDTDDKFKSSDELFK